MKGPETDEPTAEQITESTKKETNNLLDSLKPIIEFILSLFNVKTLDELSNDPEKLKKAKDMISFLGDPKENINEYQTAPAKHERVDTKIGSKNTMVMLPENFSSLDLKGKTIDMFVHYHGAGPGTYERYTGIMEKILRKDSLPGIVVCPHLSYDLQGQKGLDYANKAKAYLEKEYGIKVNIHFTSHSLGGSVMSSINMQDETFFDFMKENGSGFFGLDPVAYYKPLKNFLEKVIEHNQNNEPKIPVGIAFGFIEENRKSVSRILNSGILPTEGATITRDGKGKIVGYHNDELQIHIELLTREGEFRSHRLAIAGMNYLVSKTLAKQRKGDYVSPSDSELAA